MGLSFVFRSPPFEPLDHKPRVLVTGAAGRIGSYFALHADDRYQLRLMVRGDEKPESIQRIKPVGELVAGDIENLEQIKKFCDGIDIVLHLAANPSAEASWNSLLHTNIIGTYNVFTAALSARCRRVVYASSIHAVSGYPGDSQVKTSEPVNPGDMYGVSKCFGEALARYMAEQERMSAICLRIGAFQPLRQASTDVGIRMLDAFVSDRDLNQLIQKSIDDLRLQFAIFQGISAQRFRRLDIHDAMELVGYQPQDDVTAMHPELRDLHLHDLPQHSRSDEGTKSGLREDLKP